MDKQTFEHIHTLIDDFLTKRELFLAIYKPGFKQNTPDEESAIFEIKEGCIRCLNDLFFLTEKSDVIEFWNHIKDAFVKRRDMADTKKEFFLEDFKKRNIANGEPMIWSDMRTACDFKSDVLFKELGNFIYRKRSFARIDSIKAVSCFDEDKKHFMDIFLWGKTNYFE